MIIENSENIFKMHDRLISAEDQSVTAADLLVSALSKTESPAESALCFRAFVHALSLPLEKSTLGYRPPEENAVVEALSSLLTAYEERKKHGRV